MYACNHVCVNMCIKQQKLKYDFALHQFFACAPRFQCIPHRCTTQR